ncbi:hypothetical protein ACIQXD_25720 [Streptomyces uncialis]|uniref:hypothetical protein n=1 Tax=Streptomyces uncialis TaxID=1048205 RepID=UPI0037F25210
MPVRRLALAVTTAGILLGAVGCSGTSTDEGPDRAKGGDGTATSSARPAAECAKAAFVWSDVKRERKLTGVSELVEYDGKGELTVPVKGAGKQYLAGATGAFKGIKAEQAIAALGKHLGISEDTPLGQPGERADTGPTQYLVTVSGPGGYFGWHDIELITASFTHPCADGTGYVKTWPDVRTFALPCDERIIWKDGPGGMTGAEARTARQAATQVCPKGSAATGEPREKA